MTLLFAFLIGLFAGLRSLTPPAAIAWAVHQGWLRAHAFLLAVDTRLSLVLGWE